MADKKDAFEKIDLQSVFAGASMDQTRPRNVVEVDYPRYLHFLEDTDMDEAQKQEFLATLWTILLRFVDLGFGVHPVQQVIDDQNPNFIDDAPKSADNKSTSSKSIAQKLDRAASPKLAGAVEGKEL